MSQKHKRRIDDDKRQTARANVFERLGDSRKNKNTWSAHQTNKTNRSSNASSNDLVMRSSNADRFEANPGGRMPQRWSSSGRDRPMQQTTPTKVMKPRRMDYVDAYKQDHRRYPDDNPPPPPKHHHHMEPAPPKRRQPSMEVARDDFERKRKKKPMSPGDVSGSSISPLRSKREAKRTKYQSPSPPPLIMHKDKESRGRSKERKSKKMKEVSKSKDYLKPAKSSKSYDQYSEKAEYRSSELQYKAAHTSHEDSYERVKYKEEQYIEPHKEKKRATNTTMSPVKKSRAQPRDIETSEHEERRKYSRDLSSGKQSQPRKNIKVEPVYESDEFSIQRKKSKSKTETLVMEEPKRKKKIKVERDVDDVRYSSKSSSDTVPRAKTKRSKEEELVYYEDVRASQRPSSRHKEAKYTTSEFDSMDEPERKSKVKKKKQLIVQEIPEQTKEKKIKAKVEEPVKKKSSKFYEEEIREKPKPIKKKKRVPRKPTSSPSSSSSNTSSESESESESDARSKKRHSARDDSWERGAIPEATPERSYSKRAGYGSGKDRSISVEVEPKRKRPKLEMRTPTEPESSSRYRQVSPDPGQYSKRQEDRSYDRQSYSYEKESKRVRDEEIRDDRRIRSSEAPQKHVERRSDYIESKDVPMMKYDRSPSDTRYSKRNQEEKFYDKNYSRYDEKAPNASYDEKRAYPRREQQNFQEKRSHYDERNDPYPVDERKRDSYPTSHAPQNQKRPGGYSREPRSEDMRAMKEPPRHSDWQMDRAKKHKDLVPGYSGGIQHSSSWGDNREGNSKMRMEPAYRGNQHPARVEERNYRMPRNEARSSRNNEVRDVRGGRPDSREHQQIRGAPRTQQQDKWAPERRSYDNPDMRRSGGRYNEERNRPQEDPRFPADKASPAFHREVRRSGENLHSDLKIEVTIGGGRTGQSYDKNRNVKRSPVRKVSSYEVSKSRDRPVGKIQNERNSSLSRDRGNIDGTNYKRPLSSHGKQGPSKYQQQGSRDFSGQSRDYPDNREYSRNRMSAKVQDGSNNKVRNKDEKYYRKDAGRSEGDRSRDSSAVDRIRSRDSSAAGRDRSRDKSRQSSRRDGSRSESKPESRRSKTSKETSKDSSDRRKKKADTSEKKSKEEKATKEDEKEKQAPEAVSVLDVDWTEISSEKKAPVQLDPGSILNRFKPGNVLLRMGVSTKLLPPDLLEDVKKKCEEDASTKDDLPLVLDQELGALNRAESLRQWSWTNTCYQGSRLTSFADAEYRQKILSISQNMLYPPQPPAIINAKTYASSIKHYLNKTKIAVGGA